MFTVHDAAMAHWTQAEPITAGPCAAAVRVSQRIHTSEHEHRAEKRERRSGLRWPSKDQAPIQEWASERPVSSSVRLMDSHAHRCVNNHPDAAWLPYATTPAIYIADSGPVFSIGLGFGAASRLQPPM